MLENFELVRKMLFLDGVYTEEADTLTPMQSAYIICSSPWSRSSTGGDI